MDDPTARSTVSVGPRVLTRASAYGVLSIGLEKAVAVAVALYLAHHLGAADYGRYFVVVTYFALLQVVPDTALEAVLLAQVCRQPARRLALVRRGGTLRLAVSVVAGAVGLALLPAVSAEPGLVSVGALVAAGYACTATNAYRLLYRAVLEMGGVLRLAGVQGAASLGFVAVVVSADGGLTAVAAAVSAASAAALGYAWVTGRGRFPLRLETDGPTWGALGRAAWPVAANAVVVLGAMQAAQLLLLRWRGAEDVGHLAAAVRLVEAVNLVPQGLMLSAFPMLAAAADDARPAAARAVRTLAVALVPVLLAVGWWAEAVVAVVLPAQLAGAAPALRLVVGVGLLNLTGTVLTALLVAAGRQRVLLATNVVASSAGIVVAAALIPRYGALGPAAGAIVAGLLGQATLALLPATGPLCRSCLAALARPLAGAAVAAGTAVLASGAGGGALGTIVAFAAAYPLALWMAGVFGRTAGGRTRTVRGA